MRGTMEDDGLESTIVFFDGPPAATSEIPASSMPPAPIVGKIAYDPRGGGLTTDPDDPALKRGRPDEEPVPMNEKYLVLPDEERMKGYLQPVRRSYVHAHAPKGPMFPLRDLTAEEAETHAGYGYAKYEEYPDSYREENNTTALGHFWTQAQLDLANKVCGGKTTMGVVLAETYARDPWYYSATYCAVCHMHRPLVEFVWDDGSDQSLDPFLWTEEQVAAVVARRKELEEQSTKED